MNAPYRGQSREIFLPRQWSSDRSKQDRWRGVAAALILGILLRGLWMLFMDDNLEGILYVSGGAILLVFMLSGMLVTHLSFRRGWDGADLVQQRGQRSMCVRLRYLRWPRLVAIGENAIGAAGFGVLLWLAQGFQPTAEVGLVGEFSGWIRWGGSVVVFAVFCCIAAANVSTMIFRWKMTLGIVLTPHGIYHWNWYACVFYPWESISAVTAGRWQSIRMDLKDPARRAGDPEESWLARMRWVRRRLAVIPASKLAVHPTVGLYALGFYHRHAEVRGELGTKRAVERVSSADLPDVIEDIRRYGDIRPPEAVETG